MYLNNHAIYDTYLAKMLKDYVAQPDQKVYFEKVFSHLDVNAKNNAKVFSQLKHMSYELSEMLSKTGEIIKRITSVYSEFMISTDSHYKRIGFQADPKVQESSKRLVIGLNQWSAQLNAQKKFVIDNMSGFFHFKKHEYLEISKLIENRMELNFQFKKKAQLLDEKKQKLFDSKVVERWKVDYNQVPGDVNELFKTFQKIKPYMLPEVA